MTLWLHGQEFAYETEATARIFFGTGRIPVHAGDSPPEGDYIRTVRDGPELGVEILLNGALYERRETVPAGDESACERGIARMMVGILSEATGHSPPWGILTGVRPVKLARMFRERGMSREEIEVRFAREYLVSPEKTALLTETEEREARILARRDPLAYSLYGAIPFCPTRCKYCSFVSHSVEQAGRLIPQYLERLCEELEVCGELADKLGLRLETIYFGGGTPTVLSAEQLSRLLGTVRRSFPVPTLQEYTVEAGRPDTVTAEKLAVLREHGVNRISINPQTMNDAVLHTIGRMHTARETEEALMLARERGFRVINMDLIAGLPGESVSGFLGSLRGVIEMAPENITVHTLAIKRSAHMSPEGQSLLEERRKDAAEMLNRAYPMLREAGYLPYYLYRQKNTLGGLENIGFARPGHECRYNIHIMDESHTILAAGAGAVTKLCGPGGRIQRIFNHKYPYEYNSRFETVLERKRKVAEFYGRSDDPDTAAERE